MIIKDSNTFGIAFRYKDPYNYYIVELSKQDKGFKRIRKYVQGNSEVIDIKYNGGFNKDFSFGISFFLLDNISLIPICCTNFDDIESEMKLVVTPTCPRFSENLIKTFLVDLRL